MSTSTAAEPVFWAVMVHCVVCLTEIVVGSHVCVTVSGLAAVVPAAALRAARVAARVAAGVAAGVETVSRWPAGRNAVRSGDACAGAEKAAAAIGDTSAATATAVVHRV